jgi:hypothetical protein
MLAGAYWLRVIFAAEMGRVNYIRAPPEGPTGASIRRSPKQLGVLSRL